MKILTVVITWEIGDLGREAGLILSEIVLKNDKASQALIDDEECFTKILGIVREDFIEVGRDGDEWRNRKDCDEISIESEELGLIFC